MNDTVNIAHYLRDHASERPFQRAIVFPDSRDSNGLVAYTHLTFRQLDRESDAIARGFAEYGIGRGCLTILMTPPSLELFALTFALFKVGAVPVLIDPGMGRERLLECIEDVAPEALVGIPKAHVARRLFPRKFRSVTKLVTVGRRLFWGGKTLDEIRKDGKRALKADGQSAFEMAPTSADETAAILFTTGSTGPAKGVVYSHGAFDAQTRWIQSFYGIEPGEIDLPGFPLFALFSCAMGMTCVIPDMDPTRPASVDPRRFIESIHNQGCSNSFGSPAIWNRVSAYCVEHGVRLPTLRRVLMAGAPVPGYVLERMSQIMAPDGDCHTPYGATESLPVSSIAASEILAETDALSRVGAGTCVGRPLPGVTVCIIAINDEAIEEWDDALALPDGAIGEIVVHSEVVTREYHNKPEHTRLAKMRDGDTVRHRMGDVGYIDQQGRVWFCGRKSHRVVNGDQTWFSVRCEAIFNQHNDVFRSALVGVGEAGNQRPVIVIEPTKSGTPSSDADRKTFTDELFTLAVANELTRDIADVLFHPSFPVDIRHNAKIFREQLAVWATEQLQ